MFKFVEMENGNLFRASEIVEVRPVVTIHSSAEKCKIAASIVVDDSEQNERPLITAIGEAEWTETNMWSTASLYGVNVGALECDEKGKLEQFIQGLFPDIVNELNLDMNIYRTSPRLREQLQQATQDEAEEIVKVVEKMFCEMIRKRREDDEEQRQIQRRD